MEQVIRPHSRLHPLLTVAAVAVIAVSATGIAALTGVLPMHKPEAPALISSSTPAVVAPLDTPPTNTIVIQNSTAPLSPPLESLDPPAKPAPKVTRTKSVHVAASVVAQAQPTASASAPAPHPSAVSANSYDAPMPPPPAVSQMQAPPVCGYCGTIEGVREVKQAGQGTGVGAVAGGVGGAVIGKQFGNGRGSNALAILGAVGGAIAGHQVEKSVRSTTTYEVSVRMEDGSTRSIAQATPPAWRTGERVRVEGNTISVL